MATAADLNFTYTQIDRLFRLSIGEMADFSGAKYDGDFSLPLETAQRRKHEFMAAQLGIGPGTRVLDLGCGWGPFLNYARSLGAIGTGVTLSSGQAAACRRNGLDVHVMDVMQVTPETFNTHFDAVVSVGAFEHFCSREQYRAGQQAAIYAGFFRGVHALLKPGGKLFLQTMVFGKNMIAEDRLNVDAPHLSDEHVLGLLACTFPGSWLPYGKAQLVETAAPHFTEVTSHSGRLDYIETIKQWRARFAEPSFAKTLVRLSLLPKYLTSRDFRNAFASGISANTICFERELLEHYRVVFQRT